MSNIRYIAVVVLVAGALSGCVTSAAPDSPVNINTKENTDTQIPLNGRRANQPSLASILASLRDQSTPEQYQIFADAIHSSPKLRAQLQALVDAGLLTQLRVGRPGEDTWGAWRKGGEWVFMPDFIASQAPHLIVHIMPDGGILPNNMAFALGFMAWRAQHDSTLTKEVKPLLASRSKEQIDHAAALAIQVDACASIQGWNDVVDVAVHQNRSAPPTPMQIMMFPINLLYGERFIKVLRIPYFHFDENSGSIPMDKKNIDAMTEAVSQSRLTNIKPYMFQNPSSR